MLKREESPQYLTNLSSTVTIVCTQQRGSYITTNWLLPFPIAKEINTLHQSCFSDGFQRLTQHITGAIVISCSSHIGFTVTTVLPAPNRSTLAPGHFICPPANCKASAGAAHNWFWCDAVPTAECSAQVWAKFVPVGFLPSVDLYIEAIPLVVHVWSQRTTITENNTVQETIQT